jgi:hypothetical protein
MLTTAGIVLVMLVTVAVGQRKEELDRLNEKLNNHLESRLPGWQHKWVEPFRPSSNILVQLWYRPNKIVQLAVAVRESAEDAKKEIKRFLEFRRDPRELSEYGDEAYFPERDGYSLVLRKARYVIYLSIVVDDDLNAQNLSPTEHEKHKKADAHKTLQDFAAHLSALDLW